MGQSLSLCGARSRPSRSPSVCYMQADVEFSGGIAPLPALHTAKLQQSSLTRQQDVQPEAQQLSARKTVLVSSSTLLVHDGSDSEDDDEEQAAIPQRFSALQQRKDGSAAQLASGSQLPLSSFSSASSLSASPVYPDNLAYYSTDDDSPLSSSSSSLSAQQSPANLVPSSHRIHVTPSASAAAAAASASSASVIASSPSSSSSPHAQLSSSSSSHPFPAAPYLPQRSLTASASSSSLVVRGHSLQVDAQYAHSGGFHHSRSHHCLSSCFLQQPQHPTAAFPASSQPRLMPTVNSSITLSSSVSLSSCASSPACPSAASCAATPETDCRPIVTHNAVISIRPSCGNLAALVAADSADTTAAAADSSSSSGRKFRSHRRPVALSSDASASPTAAVMEDDSPAPTFSRSLFTPSCSRSRSDPLPETLSPGSHPGTVLSLLRGLA